MTRCSSIKIRRTTAPRQALNVAQTHLKIGNFEHALEWLEAGVNRGLQSYAIKKIPASFLIDRTGILRHVNLTGDNLRNAIGQLIKE